MRHRVSCLLAAIAALQLAASPAAAQDAPRVFKPAGQWVADFGDDYCRLMRNFSNGTDTVSLALERIEPGPGMRLVMIGDAVRTFRGADELGWTLLPGTSESKSRYVRSVTPEGQQYLNLGAIRIEDLPPPAPGAPPPAYDRAAEQARGKAITGIRFASGLVAPIEIETGRLEGPVNVLQACADDLVKSWGVDAERNKGATRPLAEGLGSGWLPQGTVPFREFGKLGGGANMVRLMVDAEGKATGCAVHWATLDKDLNERICAALLKSAKFTPAKDAQGQPMASYWFGSPLLLGPPPPGRAGRR